ncbi:thiamine ABC transporter ATP-binding protein [Cucumibacter marinus]|uniref:thiamine ABC transporter ATP-binding protein n=1 Tax=Cucumibacter marinus TaxID=1121252 RepID=UPI0003FB7264|nr:ATP-binding cassette domain-containing protein [Cucumibacter marinus]
MLALDALEFAYPGGPAFTFDLSVGPGEILGIIGRSGSGKSTLLDLIAGFRTPKSGNLTLDGADLLPRAPEARPVSILFQSGNLFDHLSAARNIALGLPAGELRGPEGRARIEAALEEVGLGGLADRRASRLSGGQQQRVALARTLIRDKPILLLDEPLTGLDPETAADMRALIRDKVSTRGWHTILVSHDTDDIAALADSTLEMENGRLVPAAIEAESDGVSRKPA